jgi:hypothetical protein
VHLYYARVFIHIQRLIEKSGSSPPSPKQSRFSERDHPTHLTIPSLPPTLPPPCALPLNHEQHRSSAPFQLFAARQFHFYVGKYFPSYVPSQHARDRLSLADYYHKIRKFQRFIHILSRLPAVIPLAGLGTCIS